jgi:glycosyltransferase involved in cell wall biosynthesis
MSCGVPCVSTQVGGVTEVLGDTGMLTPLAQPEAMAEAALTLLRDPDAHRQASIASRKRAVTHFEQRDVVGQYLDLYRTTLKDS